jgi:hypothetical protein
MFANLIRFLAQHLSPRPNSSAISVVRGAQATPHVLAGAALAAEQRDVSITLGGLDKHGQSYRFELVNDPSGVFQVVGDQLVASSSQIDPKADFKLLIGVVDSAGRRSSFELTMPGDRLIDSVVDTPAEIVIEFGLGNDHTAEPVNVETHDHH